MLVVVVVEVLPQPEQQQVASEAAASSARAATARPRDCSFAAASEPVGALLTRKGARVAQLRPRNSDR